MILRIYWFCAGIIAGMLLSDYASAEQTRVAILDNGFQPAYATLVPLCSNGHYDFVKDEPKIGVGDDAHGTLVALSASRHLPRNKGACFVIYRVHDQGDVAGRIVKAIDKAIKDGVKYLNISLEAVNSPHSGERRAINKALKNKIHVFIAAGNTALDLNKECRSYPSCYEPKKHPHKHVVGAYDKYNNRAFYSNYGEIVTEWHPGDFQGAWGTSFASPSAMGYFIKNGGEK